MTKFMNVEAMRFSFESVNGCVFLALESGITKANIAKVSTLVTKEDDGTKCTVLYTFDVVGSENRVSILDSDMPAMYASYENAIAGIEMTPKSFGLSALVKGKTWATVTTEYDEEDNKFVCFSAWASNGNLPVEAVFDTVEMIRTYDDAGKATESYLLEGTQVNPGVDIFTTREDCLNITPMRVIDENGARVEPARLGYLMVTEEQRSAIDAFNAAYDGLFAAGLEIEYSDGKLFVFNASNLQTEKPEVAEGEPEPQHVHYEDIRRVSECVAGLHANLFYRKA